MCYLSCNLCQLCTHISCLSDVTKTDSIYVERNSNDWYCNTCVESIFPFNWIDDDTIFYETLAEQWFNTHDMSLSELHKKVFIPFELNDEIQRNPLFESDPDLQYFNAFSNTLTQCDYHLEF